MTGETMRSFQVTRTRTVTETVTVHRMPSLDAAIQAAAEAVDDGTGDLTVNEKSTSEPWRAVLLCPCCGCETMVAPDGWAECASTFVCGWTEFHESLELARAGGLL